MKTTRQINGEIEDKKSCLRSERGAVLIVVVVLSAIALILATTLTYMVMMGTQITGMEKRYRTARDAGFGGWETMKQFIDLQNKSGDISTYLTSLSTMHPVLQANSNSCSGPSYPSGWMAKVMVPKDLWSGCNSDITIDPSNPNTYDIYLEVGSGNVYRIYGKIVHNFQGNTGGGYDSNVRTKSGVVSSGGDLEVPVSPTMYAVEVEAVSKTDPNERAKLSILYQY